MNIETSTTEYNRRYWYEEKITPPGNTNHYEQGSVVYYSNSVQRAGPLKGYRQIISRGDNATTTLSGTRYEVNQTPISLRYGAIAKPNSGAISHEFVVQGNGYVHSTLTSFPGQDALLLAADNLALTRFYSALSSQSSAFKGMVLAGELRQSLQMIRHPAQALRRGIDSYLANLRRFGPRIARQQRESFVRRTWLEYTYGWRPLISDIDGAIQQFYRSQWIRPIFIMVRGNGEKSVEVASAVQQSSDFGYGHKMRWEIRMDAVSSAKYYGILDSVGDGAPNVHSYGFSPHEFVPTIYNLIPYSFLVDYFTNIGDIVSSWSYRFIRPRWTAKGYKTTIRSYVANQRFVYEGFVGSGSFNIYTGGSPGSSEIKYTSVGRYSSVPLELPTFEVRVPGMDSLKWVNIAALSANLGRTTRSLL
jgi:hypothetical protein